MASLDVIRTLTIRAQTEGTDQAAASVKKLAAEQEGLAAASVKTEKATLSVDAALARTERRYDQEARAAKELARVQQDLNAAREAGRISQQRQNELMAMAIRAHNTAGAAAKQQSQAIQELSTASQGLAGNLGAVGGILARMGPAGLAVAAAVGATVGIFVAASVAALKFAEDMGKLADAADTVGVTVEQLRALQLTAGEVGVSAEQLDTGLGKFAATLGQVRDGNEGAVKSFDRLAPGLAGAVREAKNTEQALNLVFEALRKADAAGAALGAKELFGKQGLGFVRIAGATDSIAELESNINKLDVVTTAQAKGWDQLGDSISKNMKLAGTNVVSSFATPVLGALDAVSTIILELSRTFKLLVSPFADSFDISPLENFRVELQILNFEIQNFGAGKAVTNISDRLFGTSFTAFVSTTIGEIQSLAAAFSALIDIISGAASALKNFATGNFGAVGAATAQVVAGYSQLNSIIFQTGNTAATTSGQVQTLNEVNIQSEKATSESAREWFTFGNSMEKIGNIVPPVSAKINDFGKANDLAAGKVKKTKDEVEKVNPILKELGQVAGQLGGALVTAFLNGDSAAKALNTTLKSISSSAASSAINKLVTGDFTGAAVSGAISLGAAVGSFLFGDDKDEKAQQEAAQKAAEAAKAAAEALQAARDAFAGLSKEIQDFTNTARGTKIGELTEALAAFSDESVKLQQAAIAAQNEPALEAIRQTAAAGMNRFLRQFLNDVDDLISEFGTEGVMQDARQSVRDMMLEFSGLQDSIDEFARRTGADTEILRQKLQTSTFRALVEMLGDTSTQLSETGQEIARLKGIASELDDALVQLGVSAEDAAFIVEARLNVSLRKLGTDLFDPIIREINAFVGGDWINQATDLLARVRQLTADATELGLDTSLIQTFYILSARNIINQNQLVGDSFNALVNMLGLAGAGLKEFNAALESVARTAADIADAILKNEDRLFAATHRSDSLADQLARFDRQAASDRAAEMAAGGQALASLEAAIAAERLNIINDFFAKEADAAKSAADDAAAEAERVRQAQIEAEQRAADERIRILKEAQDFLEGATRRIQEFIDHFLASAESTLPPSQQLASAQQSFATQYAQALAGNRDALSGITSNAQDVIDAARRYYGSSAPGQSIINNLISQLQGLPGLLSPEQFIVDNLTPPIVGVGDTVTDTTTTQTSTLAALLNNLKLAVLSNDAQAIAIALLPLFNQLDTTMDQALSFAEFQAGLGDSISPGILQSIFNELDLNGDQLLQKSELIAVAAQGSNAKLDPIKDNTAAQKDLLQIAADRIAAASSENVLWLSQIWDKITVMIQQQQAMNGYLASIAAWAPGASHAAGGLLQGPLHSAGGIPIAPGHYAEGGEYIMSRRTVASVGVNTLNAMNFGGAANDNIFSAIRGLERSLMRGIAALIETQLESAGIISAPIREGNKLQRSRRGEKKKAA